MRVALICFKGLPIYGIQLANGLGPLIEMHLFLVDAAAAKYARFIDPSVKLHAIPTRRYKDPRGFFVSLSLIRDIVEAKCHVAHLVLGEPWFNLCVPFIRSFPLVTTVHDVRYHTGDRRSSIVPQAVTDLGVKFSSGLIVHGSALKEYLCREFGTDPGTVFNIPHMNYSFYRYWENGPGQEEPNNILFFGSIWEYKGLEYLIKAERFLREKLDGFKVTIAGTGESISKYKRHMIDVRNYEIINEFIPDEKVAALFQKASVVVLPYVDASQSGVVPLAFSFGKPVVATDVGSIPEAVDHGVNGLIVAPRDPRALAEAIIAILNNATLRDKMIEGAKHKAYVELSWTRIAEMHLNAYSQTLERFNRKHNG